MKKVYMYTSDYCNCTSTWMFVNIGTYITQQITIAEGNNHSTNICYITNATRKQQVVTSKKRQCTLWLKQADVSRFYEPD